MKAIASILFFVFSCTITLPLAQSIFAAKKVTVFVVDEEKSTSNQLTEIKEQKQVYSSHILLAFNAFEGDKKLTRFNDKNVVIPAAPLLEKPTPPPNFC
jgi:hypothetical protein